MTDIELEYAKQKYRIALEGKKNLLECVSKYSTQQFLGMNTDLTEEKIKNISEDEMLRNAFLSVFQNTQENSKFMVFINTVLRNNDKLDDCQPELIGVGPYALNKRVPNGLNTYDLYCSLENNKPILIGDENNNEFIKSAKIIYLPSFVEGVETYRYSSTSLEKITKGPATIQFNKLQLYYFKQLLETSREKANAHMLSLTKQDYEHICL